MNILDDIEYKEKLSTIDNKFRHASKRSKSLDEELIRLFNTFVECTYGDNLALDKRTNTYTKISVIKATNVAQPVMIKNYPVGCEFVGYALRDNGQLSNLHRYLISTVAKPFDTTEGYLREFLKQYPVSNTPDPSRKTTD